MEAQSMRPLVRVLGVSVSFGGRRALNNIDFEIFQGGHTALTGANGAGKSTLLALLRGERYPDQGPDGSSMGQVLWYPPAGPDAPDTLRAESAPLAGRGMCALLSPAVQDKFTRRPWHISGEEAIMAGLYDDFLLYREPAAEQYAFCRKLAADLGAAALLERMVSTFSQGEMRLMLLTRALARKPALLLLDEAVDGLDAKNRRLFLRSLEALPEATGGTLLISTHRPEYLPGFVTRRLHMRKGVFVPVPPRKSTPPPASGLSAGASLEQGLHTAPAAAVSGGADIELRNVSVFINHHKVLHEVNWQIRPGQNWLVQGGNGAGKSTLLRLLMAEENAALGGSVLRRLPGQGSGVIVELARIQRGIHIVSDRLQTHYYDIPVQDVVFSGIDASVGVYRDPTPDEIEAVRLRMTETGVENLAQRPLRSLSTGQARRVLLARALMGKPDLLLLDEPFSGLDPEGRAFMSALLQERAAAGLQLILVSHYPEDTLPCITHSARLENGVFSVVA